MKTKTKNQCTLILFCILIGAFAGVVVYVFLKLVSGGTDFLWEWLPARFDVPWYPLLICGVGGLIIGLFRKKFGDYPEELDVVMGKVKKNKTYEYREMLILIIGAALPLMIGSSVGPEAGLAGIMVAVCCWAGENLRFAKQNSQEYSEIGMAVSLSVLFGSPLFGVFAVKEGGREGELLEMTKSSKILLYGVALAAGTGAYMGLSHVFGAGMSGFPSFEAAAPRGLDFVMIAVYVAAGWVLSKFYQMTHHGCHVVAGKIPAIARETVAGVLLGVVACLVPAVLFSGEHQMGVLIGDYLGYLPIALIGFAFLKIIITNICIQCGLKGGHFFPLIFAGVTMGYGLAMLVFPDGGAHVVFAAAIVTASLLGNMMKKPLAVTMLLFICFPVKMFIWIFLAAVVGSKLVKNKHIQRTIKNEKIVQETVEKQS
ncbi:MAG: chloride channel protein [Eubacterium sp.]|nr:chloride channel protein [Eubacterium sp.]